MVRAFWEDYFPLIFEAAVFPGSGSKNDPGGVLVGIKREALYRQQHNYPNGMKLSSLWIIHLMVRPRR